MENIEPNRKENIVIMNNDISHSTNELPQNEGFAKGIDLIFNSLFEFSKRASLKIGFGALAFGLTYSKLTELTEFTTTGIICICIGIFCIAAKIGGVFDFFVDNKVMKTQKKNGKNKSNDEIESNVKQITTNAI